MAITIWARKLETMDTDKLGLHFTAPVLDPTGEGVLVKEQCYLASILLYFMALGKDYTERELEKNLIDHISHFLLELGTGVRHEAVSKSCFCVSWKPLMLLSESRDMNKELYRQCDEMLISIGRKSQDEFSSDNHNWVSC